MLNLSIGELEFLITVTEDILPFDKTTLASTILAKLKHEQGELMREGEEHLDLLKEEAEADALRASWSAEEKSRRQAELEAIWRSPPRWGTYIENYDDDDDDNKKDPGG